MRSGSAECGMVGAVGREGRGLEMWENCLRNSRGEEVVVDR